MTRLADDPAHAIPAANALRRSRGRWRLLAFVFLALAVLALLLRLGAQAGGPGPYVARVEIDGTITTDPERVAALERIARDDSAQAVIVAINSPGGTTAGGEELYESLRRLSAQKPTVAAINELGASAAYMSAIGTDRIYARRLSLVGSIGVLVQHVDAGELLDTIGVDLDTVASGDLKGEPELDGPIPPDVRENLQQVIDSSHDWFVDIVAARRDLERADVLALADGRILDGRLAREAGLIDAFGGESEIRAWFEQTHTLDPDLPVATVYPQPDPAPDWLGYVLGSAVNRAIAEVADNGLTLDGLIALWHPQGD